MSILCPPLPNTPRDGPDGHGAYSTAAAAPPDSPGPRPGDASPSPDGSLLSFLTYVALCLGANGGGVSMSLKPIGLCALRAAFSIRSGSASPRCPKMVRGSASEVRRSIKTESCVWLPTDFVSHSPIQHMQSFLQASPIKIGVRTNFKHSLLGGRNVDGFPQASRPGLVSLFVLKSGSRVVVESLLKRQLFRHSINQPSLHINM